MSRSENLVLKNDFTELNNFVKGLSRNHSVLVGIFGNKASRNGDDVLTNPEVGAIHEFGSHELNVPARSFLKMPLIREGKRILTEAVNKGLPALLKGNTLQALRLFGIACENAIQRAFVTSGWGSWKPLKDPTRHGKNKNGDAKPLIDTGQLRRSITSKVVD